MKKLILLCSAMFLSSAYAQDCVFKTSFKDMTSLEVESVICNEVLRTVERSFIVSSDVEIYIEATGQRSTYKVELNEIVVLDKNKKIYEGSGVLKWNPDVTKVILD